MGIDFMLERLGMSVEDAEQIKERCDDKGITVRGGEQSSEYDGNREPEVPCG